MNIMYCEWINEHNILYKMHVYGLKKITSLLIIDDLSAYLNPTQVN